MAPHADPMSAQLLELLQSMQSTFDSSQQIPLHLSSTSAGATSQVLQQLTPNTRRMVSQKIQAMAAASPGECPCCRGKVLTI